MWGKEAVNLSNLALTNSDQVIGLQRVESKGIMRNSKFNHGTSFFPVWIFFKHVFPLLVFTKIMVYSLNASELELLEVLVQNYRFPDSTADIVNQGIWRGDLVFVF